MSKRKCGLCGRDPAAGFASVDGVFYCHGDDDPDPTCYMRAPWPVTPISQTGKRYKKGEFMREVLFLPDEQ